MDSTAAIAIVVLIVLAVWWVRRGSDPTRHAETQLRRICFGDNDQVDRLIEAEMARAPGISRAEAANRAVYRYRRDNR
jgi:hypothetical protein